MSSQYKDYKKTIAIQTDLNWDGDPSLDDTEEDENAPQQDAEKDKPES